MMNNLSDDFHNSDEDNRNDNDNIKKKLDLSKKAQQESKQIRKIPSFYLYRPA